MLFVCPCNRCIQGEYCFLLGVYCLDYAHASECTVIAATNNQKKVWTVFRTNRRENKNLCFTIPRGDQVWALIKKIGREKIQKLASRGTTSLLYRMLIIYTCSTVLNVYHEWYFISRRNGSTVRKSKSPSFDNNFDYDEGENDFIVRNNPVHNKKNSSPS